MSTNAKSLLRRRRGAGEDDWVLSLRTAERGSHIEWNSIGLYDAHREHPGDSKADRQPGPELLFNLITRQQAEIAVAKTKCAESEQSVRLVQDRSLFGVWAMQAATPLRERQWKASNPPSPPIDVEAGKAPTDPSTDPRRSHLVSRLDGSAYTQERQVLGLDDEELAAGRAAEHGAQLAAQQLVDVLAKEKVAAGRAQRKPHHGDGVEVMAGHLHEYSPSLQEKLEVSTGGDWNGEWDGEGNGEIPRTGESTTIQEDPIPEEVALDKVLLDGDGALPERLVPASAPSASLQSPSPHRPPPVPHQASAHCAPPPRPSPPPRSPHPPPPPAPPVVPAACAPSLQQDLGRETLVAGLMRQVVRRTEELSLSRSWFVWLERHRGQKWRRRLLVLSVGRDATGRVAHPKLATFFVGWRRSWEETERSEGLVRLLAAQHALHIQRSQLDAREAEMEARAVEMEAREAAMEARAAALDDQLAKAMKQMQQGAVQVGEARAATQTAEAEARREKVAAERATAGVAVAGAMQRAAEEEAVRERAVAEHVGRQAEERRAALKTALVEAQQQRLAAERAVRQAEEAKVAQLAAEEEARQERATGVGIIAELAALRGAYRVAELEVREQVDGRRQEKAAAEKAARRAEDRRMAQQAAEEEAQRERAAAEKARVEIGEVRAAQKVMEAGVRRGIERLRQERSAAQQAVQEAAEERASRREAEAQVRQEREVAERAVEQVAEARAAQLAAVVEVRQGREVAERAGEQVAEARAAQLAAEAEVRQGRGVVERAAEQVAEARAAQLAAEAVAHQGRLAAERGAAEVAEARAARQAALAEVRQGRGVAERAVEQVAEARAAQLAAEAVAYQGRVSAERGVEQVEEARAAQLAAEAEVRQGRGVVERAARQVAEAWAAQLATEVVVRQERAVAERATKEIGDLRGLLHAAEQAAKAAIRREQASAVAVAERPARQMSARVERAASSLSEAKAVQSLGKEKLRWQADPVGADRASANGVVRHQASPDYERLVAPQDENGITEQEQYELRSMRLREEARVRWRVGREREELCKQRQTGMSPFVHGEETREGIDLNLRPNCLA